MLKMWKVNDDGQMDVGQRMISIAHFFKKKRGPKSDLSTISHLLDRAAIFVYSSAWKHKLGTGCWDLVSCQVSLNSIRLFLRSRKCLCQSEARATILFFYQPEKDPTNLVEDVEIWLPVKFRWIPFNGFRREVEIVSSNKRPGRPFERNLSWILLPQKLP